VIERVGVFMRLEAIRTEKHQTRFQPLQPYMDKDAIVRHTRPWQQVLMFFARTQKEHAWKSPGYKFTRQQQEAWKALISKAEAAAAGEAEEDDDKDDDKDDKAEADEEQGSTRQARLKAIRLYSYQESRQPIPGRHLESGLTPVFLGTRCTRMSAYNILSLPPLQFYFKALVQLGS
jgi:hypothetical protein